MRNKEIRNSKIYKIVTNVLFGIFMIIILSLIAITAQSKFTGQEPNILNHRIYIVDSGSMSPTINRDAMIIVREAETKEIVAGDIITYYGHDKSSRVTHRAMEILEDGAYFVTRGDANNADDPNPLSGENLIGKVVFTIPLIGKVFRFLNTRMGIGVLATLIILWIIVPIVSRKIRRPKKNSSIRVD